MGNKLGFCTQQYDSRMNPILEAEPAVIVCIENEGLIGSLKPIAPNALYIYRKYRDQQLLDSPVQRATEHVELLKPVINRRGDKYSGFELYNEIAHYDLDMCKRFVEFELKCLDLLQAEGVFAAVDNDSTRHPVKPQAWPDFWKEKAKVYNHPAAKWRCRHEYLETLYYQGDRDGWARHLDEMAWLRANGHRVLPHIIGEWGWDQGPPMGPWPIGVKNKEWTQGAKDFDAIIDPAVIAYCWFILGRSDPSWKPYDLLSPTAPPGIIEDVVAFMKRQPVVDTTWARVPEPVRKWYQLLADESFRLWPYQTIPYKGVELHGDRIMACVMMNESGPTCDPNTRSVNPAGTFNGQPFYAWGLLQVIARVVGHTWFSTRPTIEELKIPAINIKWGTAIFHGTLTSAGDLWEALRRYCGMAAPAFTMEQFWDRYGRKFRDNYKDWFGVDIPAPEESAEVAELKAKVAELERKVLNKDSSMTAAVNTLQGGLGA